MAICFETVVRQALRHWSLSDEHLRNVQLHATSLPYHNSEHARETAARVLCLTPADADVRPLLLAALYHDLGHTGTPNEDYNIANALGIWFDWGVPLELGDDGWLDDVSRLIQATRWPHRSTLRHDETVLREADALQTFNQPRWLARLTEETGKPVDPLFALTHVSAQPVAKCATMLQDSDLPRSALL